MCGRVSPATISTRTRRTNPPRGASAVRPLCLARRVPGANAFVERTDMNLRLDHLLEDLRTRGADILRAIDSDPLLLKRQSGELVLANAGPMLFTPQQSHQLYAKGIVYRRDPFEVVSVPLVKIYNLGEKDVSVADLARIATRDPPCEARW